MRTSTSRTALVALTALFSSSSKALKLDVNSEDSIRNAAATVAHGLMSYYSNNQSTTAAADVGTFPSPIYWWEAGAIWGGMVDYYAYTGDASYVQATSDALIAQIGPNADYIVPSHKGDEGNDDQAFWALSAMSAAENGFPQPDGQPAWGDIVINTFNNMITRWNTEACGGGFKWQIYPENSYGYNYRNSISNGGFFQLAARLGRYTGNATYTQWAEKVWDWTESVGFITKNYEVYDGADDRQNCTVIDVNQWSYNNAIFLYGTAAMYAQTGEAKWKERVSGLLKSADRYFSSQANATNVMSEIVCEGANKCNTDQQSFKAYLGRWMGKTTVLAPFTKDTVETYLKSSAQAAAASCSGGSGNECGIRWYVGGYDGQAGVGPQLSALEVIQSLLVSKAGTPGSYGNQNSGSSSSSAAPSSTPVASSALPPSSTPVATLDPVPSVSFVLVGSTLAASSAASTAVVKTPSSSVVSAPPVVKTPSSSVVSTSVVRSPSSSGVSTAVVKSPTSSVAPASSNSPGVFPEIGPSSSYCTLEVQTVYVTVPKPTPTPSSSFCTLEVVTVTKTVSPSSSIQAIGSSSTPSSSPTPTPSSSTSETGIPSMITPSSVSTIYTSLIMETGTPTVTFSSGFLLPSSTTPAAFTGAAAPRNTQAAMQMMGAVGAVMGVVAFL